MKNEERPNNFDTLEAILEYFDQNESSAKSIFGDDFKEHITNLELMCSQEEKGLDVADVLRSPDLEEEWIEYHRQQETLRRKVVYTFGETT